MTKATLIELQMKDAIMAARYHLLEAPEPDAERIRRAAEILAPFDRSALPEPAL
jgi:hypothetical protein